MRLLKIGRDPACNIVLQSQHVSSLHAELVILDNGDMELEDKGSRNGTTLMGQPLTPGKAVKVNRGDPIAFAAVELQWSMVPPPDNNSQYKGLWGIGTNLKNEYQISGSTVSRYHATVKLGRDNKMYLFDHSKNGTTVNGQKIMANNPYRIKKKDAIVCGGVPVDLSRLPWPTNPLGVIAKVAAAVIIVCGLGYGIYKLPDIIHPRPKTFTDEELYAMYNNSVVWIGTEYHFKVSIEGLSDAVLTEVLGVPTDLKEIDEDGNYVMGTNIAQATGFFVSSDGKIVTNLHVAKPWLYTEELEYIKDVIGGRLAIKLPEVKKELLWRYILGDDNLQSLEYYVRKLKVEGYIDNIWFIPQGKYFSGENAVSCRVLSAGADTDIDVALIQSNKGELPAVSRCINVKDSMDVDDSALAVGTHMVTMGFPHGVSDGITQDLRSVRGLQVVVNNGSITQASREYDFQYNAPTAGGASGSPVFDNRGMLIGIHHAGLSKVSTQGYNFAIKARYIKELLDGPYKK